MKYKERKMNYFPTYLAFGKAFCNRKEETKRLIYNIENQVPTLIMSPRRYGKTSLALNSLKKLKQTYSHIDLYKELSEEGVERAILNGIGSLIGKLESRPKQLLKLASDFFADMEIKVVIEKAGLSLDFTRNKKNSSDNISLALEKLQLLARKKKQHVVLFMDEFQVLGEITKTHSIEAAIRHMAQQPNNISYIFSGSNRHLLQEMFYDKKRPFYKLCDAIILDRISENDYKKHLQKLALETWKKRLSDKLLDQIITITERHPYYVNKLCSLIWRNNYPTKSSINDIWREYVLENKSVTERELELMSMNQRKVLIYLARNEITKEPYSTEFVKPMNISLGSLSQALKTLVRRDYVYIDKDGYYQILDPLVKFVLAIN